MAKADCTRGCWIAGGAVGLLVWAMSALGDLRWYEAPFLGLITFYLMSRFLIWALCEGNFDQPSGAVAKPAAADYTAAPVALASGADAVVAQPASDAVPAVDAEVDVAPLPAITETAERSPVVPSAAAVEPAAKAKKVAKDKPAKKDAKAKAKAGKADKDKPAKKVKSDKDKAAKAEKRARKEAKAAAVQPSVGADDLKQIKGVGPKLEELLNENGVSRFAQIAGWSDADIDRFAELIGRMGGRIRSDDWKEQARILAEGGKTEFSQRVDKGEVY